MKLTSGDRVVYPKDGITKGDVFEYYRLVAPYLLEHLAGRALTVERYPSGTGAEGFMQKNIPSHAPENLIGRHEVPREEGGTTTYPLVHDSEGILFFANLGVITFHVPPSRIDQMNHPDWVIWDIDPPPDETMKSGEAAKRIREVLDTFELPSLLMTSGSKGYHLRTRIKPVVDTGEVSDLARGISALAADVHPDLLTLSFRKADRGDRVFVDWLRNMPLSTSVAPWSLRARAGAPVATPIAWDEIDDVPPDGITLGDVGSRLTKDVWAEVNPVDISETIDRVVRALEDAGIPLEPFDRFRS